MNVVRIQLFEGPGNPLREMEYQAPEIPGEGEVLVEIDLATICGSDLHTFDGLRTEPVPCILGHEAVGHVVQAGPHREYLQPGDRVTWSIADSCGKCPACTKHDLPQKCHSLFKYGHAAISDGSGLNGCYASRILLRRGTNVVKVPNHLSDAMVAPVNCALATMVNAVSWLPGHCENALVQGAGLLGLYGCALLKERGVRRVFCVDVDKERLKQVPLFGGIPINGLGEKTLGEIDAILEATGGGMDCVLEVSGSASLVPRGVELLRAGGFYGFVGMVHPDSMLAITGEQIIRKCLTIRGIHNYAPWHLNEAVSFLSRTSDKYPYASLVSPAYSLSGLSDAFAVAKSRKWARVSVKPNP